MTSDQITVQGARQHNLKNIDICLPKNKLVVITGLSGSGKSSLAFDTLYAEGQRRYVESLSTYARQFLERMMKPDLDSIEGLSPSIAIEQRTSIHNPRSTVGTATEIYDYLRLLFSRVGTSYCNRCDTPINQQTLDEMIGQVLALNEKTPIHIMAPVVRNEKGHHNQRIKQLKRDGFARLRIDGSILNIEAAGKLDPETGHTIDVVVDRLMANASMKNRIADSLELALSLSDGLVFIEILSDDRNKILDTMTFTEKASCIKCGMSYPLLNPATFSFNSPQGACRGCDGLGMTTRFDVNRIIPDPNLSLREGAILPWKGINSVYFMEYLDTLTSHFHTDIYTPFRRLPDDLKKALLWGTDNQKIQLYMEHNQRRVGYRKAVEGVIPNLTRRYGETDSPRIRREIEQYMSAQPCDQCNGSRLNEHARSVKVGNMRINDITRLSVDEAYLFMEKLSKMISGQKAMIAEPVLREIQSRLGFIRDVGIGYLTLDRTTHSLSGGESQRIRLATQIGSKLSGVMYILDEPSIGLHQRDHQRLLRSLEKMRDIGNTVLVVEHDRDTILRSDHVVDMGPEAGINGGYVVYSGKPDGLKTCEKSLTGQYLSGRKRIEVPKCRRKGSGNSILIKGASANNLKNIDVAFPLGCFTCVTGVSGSGKSSLVIDTLFPLIARKRQATFPVFSTVGQHCEVFGMEHIDKVVNIDQSPIGKTPRSNPATYTGIFSPIRDLFARTPESRARGYRSGRFSFNVKGGRCEACQGDGVVKIEMHFLPDVYVPCDACNARRYNRGTLEIRYKGKNIADVLNMTVNQAAIFFEHIATIRIKLDALKKVGLGYLSIGQSATTLSGGEAQRIKLARELSRTATGNTLYILDEPTTGLHFEDVKRLLTILQQFVDSGNTVLVIEHHMDVIKSADYIIDLGPEGGDDGGSVVGTGTPEKIAEISTSHTGRYLKNYLQDS